MPLRTGHGTGKGQPRIEVLPPDELKAPIPAPLPEDTRLVLRHPDGRFVDPSSAKEVGRRGGLAKAKRKRLLDTLGLSKLASETTLGPWLAEGEAFVKFHCSNLARQAGGELGPAPSTMIASAGLQLACSRWAIDRGAKENDAGLIKLGSSLANDSRQNLLAAYELAVREAQARMKALPPADPLGRYVEAPQS